MSAPVEIRLPLAGGELAALSWPNPGAPRLLCLHGWLDNAASFLPLAPLLSEFDLVALDFAGHGKSAHRPRGTHYYMLDNVFDVDAALDALGWERCHLLGHSLGGVVACALAAAAPERATRLVALDSIGPLSASPAHTLERLRRSLRSVRRPSRGLRDFDSIEQAAQARCAVADISAPAAGLICERALERRDGHYRWRTDPALNWHSPLLMTEEQVLDMLGGIQAPTLTIHALPLSSWTDEETVQRRFRAVPDCISESVEGNHHFHMDIPDRIAPWINRFLTASEALHERSQA